MNSDESEDAGLPVGDPSAASNNGNSDDEPESEGIGSRLRGIRLARVARNTNRVLGNEYTRWDDIDLSGPSSDLAHFQSNDRIV